MGISNKQELEQIASNYFLSVNDSALASNNLLSFRCNFFINDMKSYNDNEDKIKVEK